MTVENKLRMCPRAFDIVLDWASSIESTMA